MKTTTIEEFSRLHGEDDHSIQVCLIDLCNLLISIPETHNGVMEDADPVTANGSMDYAGIVNMVRFPGGYATIIDGTVTFHYYTQDYLGNNRALVNGSTGEIEQTVAYYPYDAVIADLGISTSYQPFKFGDKELTLQNGLNEYDFGARQYYPKRHVFAFLNESAYSQISLNNFLS